MKLKSLIKCAFGFSFLLLSCGDNKDIMWSTLPVEFETNIQEKYLVSAEPGENFSIDFTIANPLDCTIKSNQEWCVVAMEKRDVVAVNLIIKSNPISENRIATVTITSPKIKGEIVTVIEQTASSFKLGGVKEEALSEGETYTIQVSTEHPWTLKSSEEWVTFDPASGEPAVEEPIAVKVTVAPNESGIIRSAVVTLCDESGKEAACEMLQSEPWETSARVGDAGLLFDLSRIDSKYEMQMKSWISAGREGGIPALEENRLEVTKEFTPKTPVAEIKAYLDGPDKYNKRIILFRNGEYNFGNTSLRFYSKDVLVGESRDGVIIKTTANSVINLYGALDAGVRNLTLRGMWMNEDPDPTLMEEVLAGKGGWKMISLDGSANCFVDNVKIINSASHPIWIKPATINGKVQGGHNTFRDVIIDGAYNKGAGCQGYFFIGGAYNLITGCRVDNIRHISMQDPASTCNVFYKNDVNQEFSFHVNDGGDNLVEHNRITIPENMGDRTAIMGPWSGEHTVGGKNFVYRNRCLEKNHKNLTPWSDNELYIGPWVIGYTLEQRYGNFRITEGYSNPVGKTLYPVILK